MGAFGDALFRVPETALKKKHRNCLQFLHLLTTSSQQLCGVVVAEGLPQEEQVLLPVDEGQEKLLPVSLLPLGLQPMPLMQLMPSEAVPLEVRRGKQ